MMNFKQLFVFALLLGLFLSTGLHAQNGLSPDIVADKTTGCAPEVISFNVTNPPAAKSYIWIINGDTIAGIQKQDYLFASGGQYDITVIIAKTDGLTLTIYKKDLVTLGKANDNISLQVSRKVLCNGIDTVRFSATATSVRKWDWIIDGTNYLDAGNQVVHRFTSSGSKDIVIRTQDSSGCYALKTFPSAVLVAAPPVVDFSADITGGCVPMNVVLTSAIKTGSASIVSTHWSVPGSNNASASGAGPINIQYNKAGTYDVQLTLTTQDGCTYTETKKDFISAGGLTHPVIDAPQKSGCPGTVFSFFNQTVKGINTQFFWTFTGGSVQQGSNDSVQYVLYPKGGNYDVSLSSKDGGCTQTVVYPGMIKIKNVSADFMANPTCNCKVPDTVTFSNIAVSNDTNKTNYEWTFYASGGQKILGTSTANKPVFIYKDFGSYDVKLKVTEAGGCTDSVIRHDLLLFKPLDTATIFINKATGCAGEPISISANMPYACPGLDYTYEWTFYAKNSRIVLKQITAKTPQMTYSDTGSYDVRLKVTTPGGCVAEKIFVRKIWIVHPKPSYIVDTLNGCAEGTITLQQQTTPVGPDYNFSWELTNMSDSTIKVTGTGAKYRPVFPVPGKYRVKFAVTIGSGCRYESAQISYLNISGITADFTTNKKRGCLPFTTSLSDSILQNVHYSTASDSVQAEWSANPASGIIFSDIHSTSPAVTITTAGCYDISLRLTNSTGCTSVISKSSYLCAGVKAAFSIPARICLGDTLTVLSSSFNAVKYQWTSQPGANIITSATGGRAQILFPAPGHYNLRLVAFSPEGCSDTLTQSISVEHVKAEFFSMDTANACAPAYVSFTVRRNGADSFYWSFGDGETLVTADTNIAHVYKMNSGDRKSGFDVRLVAKNNLGCTDVLLREKYINVLGPVPAYSLTDPAGCGPHTVGFVNNSRFASHLFLDYGDFSDIDSLHFGPHTYTVKDPNADYAVYKPRLLAKDMYGCAAWAPAGDSIVVYRRPQAGFTYSSTGGCAPYAVQFTDTSHFATKWSWDFDNDGKTDDTIRNPKPLLQPGTYHVRLTVENHSGCTDTMVIKQSIIISPNITAKVIATSDTICSGTLAGFHCIADRPELVKTYRWMADNVVLDSTVANGPSAAMRFTTAGLHSISVTLTTLAGCEVTVTPDRGIIVPDSLEKQSAAIQYISVGNDSSIRIRWQPSANAFFAKYALYRTGIQGTKMVYSTVNKGDTAFTDHNNLDVNRNNYTYNIRETDRCGRPALASEPHTSILLKVKAIPGNKLQLNWSAYKGWNVVKSYGVYRKDAENFTLIATVSGADTVYADDDICNSTYTYRIAAVDSSAQWTSISNSASGKPDYIYRKEGENVLFATVTDNDKVHVEWSATAPRTMKYIIDRYTPESGWVDDFAESKTNIWTDDKVGVNKYNYTYRVHVSDKCGDITGAGTIGQSILLKARVQDDKVLLGWTSYRYWQQGIDFYRVEIQLNDGTWKNLAYVQTSDTIYTDAEIHKEIYGIYTYRIVAVQAGGTGISSTSNKADAILPSKVFIPNAFTPGGDQLNEIFKPVCLFLKDQGPGAEYSFSIFNRWGEKLFETNTPDTGWDGTYKGQPVPEGVYIYMFNAIGFDHQTYYLKGNVTLMR
jgi:gliding motility-associated-like protein